MIRIQLRRDESLKWLSVNPVLANGEPGYESDTGKFKIGDGHSRWSSLEYFVPGVQTDGGPPTDGGTGPGDSDAVLAALAAHIQSLTPHPVYDDGPSLLLLYQNAKV